MVAELIVALDSNFSAATLLHLAIAVAILCALLLTWSDHLDRHEHNPGYVRGHMIGILLLAIVVEVSSVMCALMSSWAFYTCLLANVWGSFDAVLRFPARHRSGSLFAWKQYTLIAFKTYSCIFGVSNLSPEVGIRCLLIFLDVWGLPLFFLMARPMDPAEEVADEMDDVDLVFRMWHLAASHHERCRCLAKCRRWYQHRIRAHSSAQWKEIGRRRV
mmetsp:Transcript_121699/g.190947  ORF Transcript_121699/g.190947 Transcript_121699/m.190947 type:complete len:217 (+) Transcript_121699:35-685(+)